MGPQNVKTLGSRDPRILKFWGPRGPKMGGPYFHMTPASYTLCVGLNGLSKLVQDSYTLCVGQN